MIDAIHTWRAEPRAPGAPSLSGRDWAMVAVTVAAMAIESAVRSDIVWEAVTIPITMAMTLTLLFRRTNPVAATAGAFVTVAALDITTRIAGAGQVEIYSTAFILLVPYSLFRWGSGRETIIGAGLSMVPWATVALTYFSGWTDTFAGLIVLAFPAMAGLVIRLRDDNRRQQIDQIKMTERSEIARELHDTVAHHVSAIAIQAQAGRVMVGASSLEGAGHALAVIEEEASRTLAEMRSMITVLRDPHVADDVHPQRGLADIGALAQSFGPDAPRVEVTITGAVSRVGPSVDAAAFRIAQESVTNAIRHGAGATLVAVNVQVTDDGLRLTIRDDGMGVRAGAGVDGGRSLPSTQPTASGSGFGLVGMTERAHLLGGSIEAGPASGGGWLVDAVLPHAKVHS